MSCSDAKPSLVESDDGTWGLWLDGQLVAKVVVTRTSRIKGEASVAVDVCPLGPSVVQAIAFGAPAIYEHPSDRITLGGRIRSQLAKGAQPFVCVDIKASVDRAAETAPPAPTEPPRGS